MSEILLIAACITGCTCAVIVSTYVMYRFKLINSVKHDLECKSQEIINRTKEINEEAERLFQARVINQQLLNDLIYKENGTKELIVHNKKIIELNKDILRKSTVEIFSAKESIIYLHDHYVRLIELIDELLKGEDPWTSEDLYRLRDTADHNLDIVSNQFISNFGKSVEQYIAEKAQIVTKKPDGSSYITPFSKN